ncbi:MAG TPA: N-6 DNA methylase, partial [Candidatus Binatia bacterium]|nr:N-6 DNA methylase [Candidatus Binatia bacterium]
EGQQHLDFDAYDFSYLPIETLSVIYEQFLHAAEHASGRSQGRERGAYYTPVPLANFMLNQLDARKPLREGMRVLDPACGSGVFLVQCYRKLIEQRVRETAGVRPRPEELSRLLTEHLFGIDTDPDACQVAELSLVLTLLDYVKPPDLGGTDFRLPTLRNQNILEGDAFDPQPSWAAQAYSARYDWVVGNPPWKELTPDSLESSDTHVFEWMNGHHRDRPTGGNQVAEAFAWRACDFVAEDGVVGLLLPAMTLFKYESERFRAKFLQHAQLWSVANFSNLAEILFAGRSRVPAAAFFYSCADGAQPPESVEFYSPLVANQVLHNPGGPGSRKQVWAIVVNASEIRDVPYREVRAGAFLPWKIAFWGGAQDQHILRTLTRHRFPTLGALQRAGILHIAEGFQLRADDPEHHNRGLDPHPELAGKFLLNTAALEERRFVFRFPAEALTPISPDRIHVRKRGGFEKPLRVCNPPHILVSAARNFAVYSDDFVVIPPRQIGIAAQSEYAGFLVALTLYLNSDFVTYHQFFTAPEFGIKRSRGTLKALRTLPVPFEPASNENWHAWKEMHERLLAAEAAGALRGNPHWYAEGQGAELLVKLNTLVNQAFGLDKAAQAAIRDLVHVRRALVDGQVGEAAVRLPEREELQAYASALQAELDGFLEGDVAARHRVTAVHGADSGMVEVDLVRHTETKQSAAVLEADDPTAREFQKIRDRLREKRSQWVYFDRNLRIYEDTRTYLFKPMQRLHWTESQAIADAGEIIADTLEPAPRDHDAAHFIAR